MSGWIPPSVLEIHAYPHVQVNNTELLSRGEEHMLIKGICGQTLGHKLDLFEACTLKLLLSGFLEIRFYTDVKKENCTQLDL